MLYEVALIQKPTKKEAEDGASEKLILPPTPVIAENEQSAGVQAVMKNKGNVADGDLERIQVLVRPFC